MKKFIAMLLVAAMVCTNITFLDGSNTVQAETVKEKAEAQTTTESGSDISVENAELIGQDILEEVYINPLYKDVVDEEGIQCDASACAVAALSDQEYISDMVKLGEAIRDAMLEREASVVIYYMQQGKLEDGFLDEWLEATLIETENPKAGDYLRWHYSYVYAAGQLTQYSNGVCQYTMVLTFTYYTTAEQEKILDKEVADVLEEIGISDNLSDYENAKKIYDYICQNITYDYDNLQDTCYTLKYSAYAAMINKTAVCQGYATLFYYMAREAGLNVRVIAGDTAGGAHAWNIIKLREVYYYLDSTWDAALTVYQYFLKGSDNFTDHASFEMYTTSEFTSVYPISRIDYVSASIPIDDFEVTLENEEVQYHDLQPNVSVVYQGETLTLNEDYTLEYTVGDKSWFADGKARTRMGTMGAASVSVVGIGKYFGEKIVPFEVVKFDLANATLMTPWVIGDGGTKTSQSFSIENFTYDGTEKKQSEFRVCDYNDTISSQYYDITYKDNINNGTATLVITGKGDYYTGTLEKKFLIHKASITNLTVSLSEMTYVYDGNVKTPTVTVTDSNGKELIENIDYRVYYNGNRTDTGTYMVKVEVDNNYRGIKELYFDIVPQGQWMQDSIGWWYRNADGTYPVNSWKDIDGARYYFNGSGYMVTGWQLIGGTWYYFSGSGAMVTGWQAIGRTWYYFDGNGVMVTGWQTIGGTWYYFNGSGAMVTGWQAIGGTWYYFYGSGAMVTGWQSIGETWYYFSGSGAMVTGWQLVGSAWYYFYGSGSMAANQWVGNYYLQADGSMAVNKRIGVYYVGADGAWIPGV